jgi:SAM-dependent methyltransferase
MQIVTVATSGDLDRARALRESSRLQNPTDGFVIVLAQAGTDPAAGPTPDDVVRLDELMLPADQLARMGALSDDAALRVALKPWAVRMLIERGADVACFLDLDAEICGSFDEVERLSEEHGVVLVSRGAGGPDRSTPPAGFDPRFLAVAKRSLPALEAWADGTAVGRDTSAGDAVSAEGRALDLVASRFGHHVIADPERLGFRFSAAPAAPARKKGAAERAARRANRRLRRLAAPRPSGDATLLRRAARRGRSALTASGPAPDERAAILAEGLIRVGEIVDARQRRAAADREATAHALAALEAAIGPDGGLLQRIEELARTTERLDAALQRLDAEQQATPFVAPGTSVRSVSADGSEVLRLSGDHASAYADFEDTYRGSEEFVRERLVSYVDIVTEGPVLDVGCGRGEFLELMRSAGIEARGIDLDASMVARAVAKGVDAEEGDALVALAASQPGELGAVTSFQVIEHIETSALRELLVNSHRALRAGGILVAETVNPHSPAALKTFWLDLTHIRPLFPESLLFLARDCGFEDAWIHFPMGSGDLDHDLRQCGEYALVARKGPGPS